MPGASKVQVETVREWQRKTCLAPHVIFEATGNFDVFGLLPEVPVPTLVMHVRDDGSTMLNHAVGVDALVRRSLTLPESLSARMAGRLARGPLSPADHEWIADMSAGPRRAFSRLMRCSKASPHSITSSARASSVAGTEKRRILAVLKLINTSNLDSKCISISPGFASFRIRSM
jgi:hypothetical protein